MERFKLALANFIKNDKSYPILYAFASGLYPLLFYYNGNLTLVNSKAHLLFFVLSFLVFPILVNLTIYLLETYTNLKERIIRYIYASFNITFFALLLTVCISGYEKKKIVAAVLLIALIIGIILSKRFKQVVVLQLILALVVSVSLIPNLFKHLNSSSTWQQIDDETKAVNLEVTPNIYLIQPDGYVNFSKISEPPYNYDNSEFEHFLKSKGFRLYDDFRSNYYSTLSSNSALFTMKHHFHNNMFSGNNELYNARNIIVGNNPVIDILKANGYKTHLFLQKPYLILNRPEIAFDYCNIAYEDFFYLSRGYHFKNDIISQLHKQLFQPDTSNKPTFAFIEKFAPGHITNIKRQSKGIEGERLNYLNNLEDANTWLKAIVDEITEHDKNALIVLIADHGGFVGFNYSTESTQKRHEAPLVNSVFSTLLAIKWPDQMEPQYTDRLKSNINLFRVLFAELSKNEKLLNHLEPDESYLFSGKALFKQIDNNGNIVFEKHSE